MIHWYINEQQADYVFKCLAQRPFGEVNALINDLYAQANPPKEPANPAVPAATPEEVRQKQQAWMEEQFNRPRLHPHENVGSVEAQVNGALPPGVQYTDPMAARLAQNR
jgi:hypothetical protein